MLMHLPLLRHGYFVHSLTSESFKILFSTTKNYLIDESETIYTCLCTCTPFSLFVFLYSIFFQLVSSSFTQFLTYRLRSVFPSILLYIHTDRLCTHCSHRLRCSDTVLPSICHLQRYCYHSVFSKYKIRCSYFFIFNSKVNFILLKWHTLTSISLLIKTLYHFSDRLIFNLIL